MRFRFRLAHAAEGSLSSSGALANHRCGLDHTHSGVRRPYEAEKVHLEARIQEENKSALWISCRFKVLVQGQNPLLMHSASESGIICRYWWQDCSTTPHKRPGQSGSSAALLAVHEGWKAMRSGLFYCSLPASVLHPSRASEQCVGAEFIFVFFHFCNTDVAHMRITGSHSAHR